MKLNNERTNKTIRLGYYSKYHYLIIQSILIVGLVLGLTIFMLWYGLHYAFLAIILFIEIIAVIVSYFVALNSLNRLGKAISKFNKSADFEAFSSDIDKILEENLNPETRAYVMLYKANAMFMYDKEEAAKYFRKINVPNYKSYVPTYEQVEFIAYVNAYNKAKCQKMIETKGTDKKTRNYYSIIYAVYFTKDDIENIEVIFNPNSRYLFEGICNMQTLYDYYRIRNNHENAKKYAEAIVEYGSGFKYIYNSAKKYLE